MRKNRSFALLLVLCLCLCATAVRAEAWSEEYYRAWDSAGALSEEEQNDLDAQCLDFVAQWHVDLALAGVTPDDYPDETLRDFGEEFYELCGFGYGNTKDGFLFVYDMETEEAEIFTFGRASGLIAESELASMAESAAAHREQYRVWGVMYAAYRQLYNTMESTGASGNGTQTQNQTQNPNDLPDISNQTARMPDWYPADPQNFTFFHDEDAPRAVDDAGLFTAAELRAMEQRLGELRAELDRDIVVFTDNSSHGLTRDVYAADFYDFNGYGCGSEREGLCLFICMEEGNRGFWTCATGSQTRELYTESNANQLDDALYEYMAAGDYAAGVMDWMENIQTLYVKGIPFAPDWYPALGESVERTHDLTAPRVVDDANILEPSEESMLEARARELSDRYGLDIVLMTTPNWYGMTSQDYADLFYFYNGYGYGDDFDGLMLGVFHQGYGAWSRIAASGTGAAKLSGTNENRLCERFDDEVVGDRCYQAMNVWLDQVDHMLRTGRVTRTVASWAGTCALGAVVGLLFGAISLGGAKRRMKTKRPRREADAYLVPGTLSVDRLRDDFAGTTTSRRYNPPPKDTGSGGSGGSSFSSSYSGSSGASHSGSGRSF